MTATELLALIQAGGPVGLITLLIVLLSRGTLVWDRELVARLAEAQKQIDEARRERDEWKNLALTGTSLAERALTTASAATSSPSRSRRALGAP